MKNEETCQKSYKDGQKKICWGIIVALLVIPFVCPINPFVQSTLYSTVLVFLGCLYAIEFDKPGQRVNQFEEKMNWTDTVSFPIYASIALVSLYFLYSILPKELLNTLFRINFCVIGFGVLFPFFSYTISSNCTFIPNKNFGHIKKTIFEMEIDTPIDVYTIMAFSFAVIVNLIYFFTGHWSLNNVLGIAFTVGGIKLMRIPNFKYSVVLLWLLFFYDIYWVFKTDVMVTVAKSLDAPIKLSFPVDLEFKKFSILGLGDMVIPGICVAVVLKFELDRLTTAYHKKNKKSVLSIDTINSWSTPMFHLTVVFYFLSIISTLVGMYLMNHAQPALLYIVPGITLAFVTIGVVFGCTNEMIEYEDDIVGVDAVQPETQEKPVKSE